MAPILANSRCIPCDEDLQRVREREREERERGKWRERVRERERTVNQLYLTAKTAETPTHSVISNKPTQNNIRNII